MRGDLSNYRVWGNQSRKLSKPTNKKTLQLLPQRKTKSWHKRKYKLHELGTNSIYIIIPTDCRWQNYIRARWTAKVGG